MKSDRIVKGKTVFMPIRVTGDITKWHAAEIIQKGHAGARIRFADTTKGIMWVRADQIEETMGTKEPEPPKPLDPKIAQKRHAQGRAAYFSQMARNADIQGEPGEIEAWIAGWDEAFREAQRRPQPKTRVYRANDIATFSPPFATTVTGEVADVEPNVVLQPAPPAAQEASPVPEDKKNAPAMPLPDLAALRAAGHDPWQMMMALAGQLKSEAERELSQAEAAQAKAIGDVNEAKAYLDAATEDLKKADERVKTARKKLAEVAGRK